MITMTESLENIALLRDLPAAELASLARRCRWRRFGAGEMVLAHLDPSTDILFLVEGRLRVSLFSAGGKEVA
ncbi:MAG: cyclic nucleotide-binding domain-containing protein, partial [Alphaproteobacteria bacterium]